MKKTLLVLGCLALFACSDKDEQVLVEISSSAERTQFQSKQEVIAEFGRALSGVVSENQSVREFLRSEALKQFDKNYDVLWVEAKDAYIDGKTLADYVAEKSSKSFVATLERIVPQLNVLLPNLPFFGVAPESYSSEDVELPVVVPSSKVNYLYQEGKLVDSVPKGYAPSDHVLVVNENSRVIVNTSSARSISGRKYRFKSPLFDGSKVSNLRSATVSRDLVGQKAIDAFSYFNREDNSDHSVALQRDYIYYGMTPSNRSGRIDHRINEYLSFIEVNPKAYYHMSDQPDEQRTDGDPKVKKDHVWRRHHDYSPQELIDELWIKGTYDIRVEVQKSTSDHPQVLYIPVRPEEIWDFNYESKYVTPKLFRSSKHWYWIKPERFTSKRYNLDGLGLSLGKWNISEESLIRSIQFFEEDPSEESTYTHQYESIMVRSEKFKDDTKIGLGLDKILSLDKNVSIEINNSNTVRETKTSTIKRQKTSDNLGHISLYFYDPIIVRKLNNSEFQIKSYSTGYVTFGVTAY